MSEHRVTLHLVLASPGPLDRARKQRWAGAVEQAESDAPALVFLTEMLGRVVGAEPAIDCRSYTSYDMFGGCSRDFTIRAGAATVSRALEQEISESWSSLKVHVDSVSIEGLPAPVFIEWDGESTGALGVAIGGLDPGKADEVVALARELFASVEIRREETPRLAGLRADLKRRQPQGAANLDAVEDLAEALQDADVEVAKGALARLAALGVFSNERVAAAVQLALGHPAWELRGEVVEVLWRTFDTRAVLPLVRALYDEREYVRKKAASGLSCLKSPWSLPPLCVAIEDHSHEVRLQAVAAISDVLKECPDPRVGALLLPLLRDEDRYVASAAAWTLAEQPDHAFAKDLVRCLDHEYFSVRHGAVLALGALGEPKLAGRLLRCLADDDASVRMAAMTALGDMAERRALPLLEKIAKRESIHDAERLLAQETMARLTSGKPARPKLAVRPFEPPAAPAAARYLESLDGHSRRLDVDTAAGSYREVPAILLPAGAADRDDGYYVVRHGDFYGVVATPSGPAFFADGSCLPLRPERSRVRLRRVGRERELTLLDGDEEVAAVRCDSEESGFMKRIATDLSRAAFYSRYGH